MKQINLKEYYPFYTTDTIIEVPDEVADILHAYKLQEAAYQLRTYRNKAYYSLDLGDGIENSVLMEQPSILEILEQQRMTELIYKGLAALPEKQRQRIYAHFFLGMSYSAIARAECCDESSVRRSVYRGLKQLQKYFLKNSF